MLGSSSHDNVKESSFPPQRKTLAKLEIDTPKVILLSHLYSSKPSADKSNIQLIQKEASLLEIGDIIELKKDTRVPADIIVLKTFNEAKDNQAFIRTDQLDGETDWKLRKAPGVTQGMSEIQLFTSEAFAEYEPPSKLIYNFQGVIQCKTEEGEKKEPLNLENTMWASTVVASKK